MSEYTEKYLESLTLKQLEKLAKEGKITHLSYVNTGLNGIYNRPWKWSVLGGSQMQPAFIYTNQEVPLPVATKHHILISSDGAATHPHQHATLSAAETEATRVAKKFPGQEVTVYTAVTSFKVEDKPVTVKTFV